MIQRLIDRALLASLLGGLAGSCLAQDYPYAPPPQPYPYPAYQYPRYQYPPYPYRPYQTYRYPASRQSYRYAQPQAYRYPAQQQTASYPRQRTMSAPAEAAYQPQPVDDTGQAPRAYSPPVQAQYQPTPAPTEAVYQPRPVEASSQPIDGVLLTPSQDGSKDITSAASAPLHDLNLTRQSIPPVLLTALADPYAPPPAYDCATLISQVDDLTAALGPDYDNQPATHTKGVTDSGGLGLTLVHGAAASLLPYDGFIKTLSGASKHDNLVLRALAAGGARRAYLKGLGEDRQCAAGGAAPRHGAAPAAAVIDSNPWRPKYPIWWDRAG